MVCYNLNLVSFTVRWCVTTWTLYPLLHLSPGLLEEVLEQLKAFNLTGPAYVVEIGVDGDKISETHTLGGQPAYAQDYTLGQEQDAKGMDGRPIKVRDRPKFFNIFTRVQNVRLYPPIKTSWKRAPFYTEKLQCWNQSFQVKKSLEFAQKAKKTSIEFLAQVHLSVDYQFKAT